MSGAIKDGGLAFPLLDHGEGMSLRDYFAAQAMAALIPVAMERGQSDVKAIPDAAYALAEAMIRARATGSDTTAASTRESGKEKA